MIVASLTIVGLLVAVLFELLAIDRSRSEQERDRAWKRELEDFQ